MIEKVRGLPDKFSEAFPYNDRPRSDNVYGVTEILYCPRKSFLSRAIPTPRFLEFDVRMRFARGHAMESVFFGEEHNPIKILGSGDLEGFEGHADHAYLNDDGSVEEIVEFKSTKRLWYTAPNGKSYYSLKYARNAVDKSDYKKIEKVYNDSHMDQLMTYMILTDAKKGYLIYYELTSDSHYTWIVNDYDIPDNFREKMVDRLNYLRDCFAYGIVPEKRTMYDWECGFCTHNKNGVCGLCDVEEFDFFKFLKKLYKCGNIDIDFNTILRKCLVRYNVEPGKQVRVDNGA